MEHTPAIHALIRLHAECGGRIKQNKLEATKLAEDMRHIEAVLHMLDPAFDARRIAARRKRTDNPWFKRGTIFRAALEVLRDAPAPMSSEEVSIALLRSKGVLEPTKDDIDRMYHAVSSSMSNNEGKTVTGIDGRPRRWRLAGQSMIE